MRIASTFLRPTHDSGCIVKLLPSNISEMHEVLYFHFPSLKCHEVLTLLCVSSRAKLFCIFELNVEIIASRVFPSTNFFVPLHRTQNTKQIRADENVDVYFCEGNFQRENAKHSWKNYRA